MRNTILVTLMILFSSGGSQTNSGRMDLEVLKALSSKAHIALPENFAEQIDLITIEQLYEKGLGDGTLKYSMIARTVRRNARNIKDIVIPFLTKNLHGGSLDWQIARAASRHVPISISGYRAKLSSNEELRIGFNASHQITSILVGWH